MGQYPDGLWGPLIIHDPNPPFHFDEEMTVTFSDWYHEEMPQMIQTYQSHAGEAIDGTPNPDAALINSGVNVSIHVKPGKTYYVHIICPGNYPGHAWLFDGHPQTTVEIDGVYVKPTPLNYGELQFPLTRVSTGQRQGVLIHTKNETDKNYVIFDTMDVNMLYINKGIIPPPPDAPTNATAWLVYNESAPLPPPVVFYSLGNDDFYDDVNYIPLDEEPLLGPVDRQIIMDMNSANISGISRYEDNTSWLFGSINIVQVCHQQQHIYRRGCAISVHCSERWWRLLVQRSRLRRCESIHLQAQRDCRNHHQQPAHQPAPMASSRTSVPSPCTNRAANG